MRTLFIVISCFALTLTGCDKKTAEGGESSATGTTSATQTTTVKSGAATKSGATATSSTKAETKTSASKSEKPYPGCIYKEDGSKEGECPSESQAKNHGQLGGGTGGTAASALPAGQYGMKFLPVDTKSGPLASAIKTAEADKDKVQRFTGTIGEVCQKKGCWFVLQDGTQQARVMMRGVLDNDTKYFRIPIKSSGKKALIEGKLITKVFTEANVKHIEYDAGRDPEKVSGSRKEFVIQARAVKIDG